MVLIFAVVFYFAFCMHAMVHKDKNMNTDYNTDQRRIFTAYILHNENCFNIFNCKSYFFGDNHNDNRSDRR